MMPSELHSPAFSLQSITFGTSYMPVRGRKMLAANSQTLAFNVQMTAHTQSDFGDSWEHEITVERILPPGSSAATAAMCLGGARACPPEDCGGIWGYANLLDVLKNARHPDHKGMKEWIGGSFDAEAFDLTGVNFWLGKLKWPRVTEAQLRKVLMGQDNYTAG